MSRLNIRGYMPHLVVALIVLALIAVAGEDLSHQIRRIETWLGARLPWSALVFVLIAVLAASVLFPDSLISIIAGAVFGLGWGIVVVTLASWIGAVVQYWLARRTLRGLVQSFVAARPALARIQNAVLHDQLRLQTLLRLTPVNRASLNYIFGATGVRFGGFALACLAMLPNLVAEVYLGYAGKHLSHMTARATSTVYLHDLLVFAGLASFMIVIGMTTRIARRSLDQALADAAVAPA